jgi:hypothetical protein
MCDGVKWCSVAVRGGVVVWWWWCAWWWRVTVRLWCVVCGTPRLAQDSIHMEAIEVISGSRNPGIADFFPALVEDSKKIGEWVRTPSSLSPFEWEEHIPFSRTVLSPLFPLMCFPLGVGAAPPPPSSLLRRSAPLACPLPFWICRETIPGASNHSGVAIQVCNHRCFLVPSM